MLKEERVEEMPMPASLWLFENKEALASIDRGMVIQQSRCTARQGVKSWRYKSGFICEICKEAT